MSKEKINIELCLGSSCFSKGSNKIVDFLEEKLSDNFFDIEISLKGCLCKDKCTEGPIVKINDKLYTNVSTDNITSLINEHISN